MNEKPSDVEIAMSEGGAQVSVECGIDFQGVTIWLGDGAPLTIDDRMSGRDVRGYVEAPLQRAAAIARLRAIADMLDDDASYILDSFTTEAAR